jgi:hypothetical protein
MFFFFLPFLFEFLDDLNDPYFIYGFSCSVLISYDVNIPCNSSMLIEFRSDLSSSVYILGLNLIGRDLSTF